MGSSFRSGACYSFWTRLMSASPHPYLFSTHRSTGGGSAGATQRTISQWSSHPMCLALRLKGLHLAWQPAPTHPQEHSYRHQGNLGPGRGGGGGGVVHRIFSDIPLLPKLHNLGSFFRLFFEWHGWLESIQNMKRWVVGGPTGAI
jgi:hypothetical protein